MAERIIDRDISFYEAMVEAALADLRRCPVAEEPRYRALVAANNAVMVALRALRDNVDNG